MPLKFCKPHRPALIYACYVSGPTVRARFCVCGPYCPSSSSLNRPVGSSRPHSPRLLLPRLVFSPSPFFSCTPLPSRPASPRRVRRRRPPRFGGCLVEDEFEADLAAAVHRLQLDAEAGSKPAAARTCGLPWLPHRAGSDRQQAAENLWESFVKCPNNIKVSRFVLNLCAISGLLFGVHAARVECDAG